MDESTDTSVIVESRPIIVPRGKPEVRGPQPETIAGFEVISAFDAAADNSRPDGTTDGVTGSAQPRKRGRPVGSKNAERTAAQPAKTPQNLIANLEALLLSVHFMGARLLSTPELELTEAEAKKLSDAVKNVAQHYQVSMDPKKLAIAELVFAGVAIYGSKAITIVRRPKGPQRLVNPTPIRNQAPPAPTAAPPPAPEAPKGPLTPSQIFAQPPVESFGI